MEHTEGELKVIDSGSGTITCIVQGEKHVAQVAFCDYTDRDGRRKCYEEQIAYAKELVRRWNSQPELLAACKASLKYAQQAENEWRAEMKEPPPTLAKYLKTLKAAIEAANAK